QFISNEAFYRQIVSGKADYKKMIDLIPSHPISNYAFQNQGNLRFVNKAREWGLDEPGFSNGSAYGDLDNDGDLDLVINNVNMPCFVYRNNSIDIHPENKFLKVALEGKAKNRFGIGSKVKVHYNNTIAYQEQMPVRGFESTVDHRLNFGLGKATKIDSVEVLRNDGGISIVKNVQLNALLTVKEANSKSQPNTGIIASNTTVFTVDKEDHGLDFTHKENDFVDFDRDRLIFHMMSTSGPKIVKGDINNDGLEDLYICGAKDQPGAIYKQQKGGRFTRTNQVLLQTDAASEDTDALFFDADGDKDMDLYVCSGGNEFSPNSTALINRLYFNDGKGNFTKSPQVLPSYIFESTSCVRAADFDGDNDLDLFVGVRLIPFRYGVPCKSYVLNNDGKGNFSDVTSKVAPGLIDVGMITDAAWFDYDKDNKPDLVITGEYMPVRIFHNENNLLKEASADAGLQNTNGWWNKLVITDINHDGYADIIAGNHGLNSRFTASPEKPVNMYVGHFAGNGTTQQVTTCYYKDSSYPIHLRHDLVSVLPYLKKKYLKYDSYKNETIADIFSPDQLNKAIKLTAYTMNTTVFINNTKGKFISTPLPVEAQVSPVYAIAADDYDNDGNIDILLGGNLYQAKPEVGIYDASYGLMLRGDGKGNFSALTPQQSGINIRGAIRDIVPVMAGKKKLMLIGENNGRLKIITRQAKPAR
ncbi:MAG TPA: FG-GAP-like repeat-containing protein, partial [Flavitalea sp.]|nr:FG-GAP-like repeat-containing protein [Flavitalea sp.]